VRRLLVLAALAAVLSACGSSAAAHTPIAFGVSGGNLVPYTVTIQPNGLVRVRGSMTVKHHRPIRAAKVRSLREAVQGAHLTSRQCPGTLPDVASRFIRVGGRTVTVHGACEPHFQTLWTELAQAVGLPLG
jgi:hypothetical protein